MAPVDQHPGARPELRRVLAARTPAERAAAMVDLAASDAEAAHLRAGAAAPMTARQHREAYGPRAGYYPGPWPSPEPE